MSYFTLLSRSAVTFAWAAVMGLALPAWAYKTERVCEMTEQTAKAKSRKVCKTLLVMTDAQKAATGKKEEKKEEKKSGH